MVTIKLDLKEQGCIILNPPHGGQALAALFRFESLLFDNRAGAKPSMQGGRDVSFGTRALSNSMR